MSVPDYLAGLACCLAAAAPLALAATALRGRLVPGWSGAPAHLASIVIWLALLLAILEVLGTLGLLTRAAIVATCVLGTATVLALDRRAGLPESGEPSPPHPPSDPVALGAAVLGVAVVAAQWAPRAVAAVFNGMPNIDTLWYHLPFAARFAETGSTTALHLTYIDPQTAFYPQNSELLHAAGILLFGNDTLSPLFTTAWLGVALLAAWCCGRPYGLAPVTLLATTLVLGSWLVIVTQPGDGTNDIAAAALVLCAAAFVLNGGVTVRPLVLAGLAAGLAIGTKLTAVALVGAVTLGILVVAWRGRRAALAWAWLGPLALTGGYWYARNLLMVGNPLPWTGFGPLSLPSPEMPLVDRYRSSVSTYITDGQVWETWFRPALEGAWGPLWFVIVAIVVFAAVASLLTGPTAAARVLGAGVCVAALAYLVTPGSAAEGGSYFLPNMRYLWPALLVALVLFPVTPALAGRGRRVAAALLLLLAVMSLQDNVEPQHYRRAALLAFVLVVAPAAGLAALRGRTFQRGLLVGAAVVAGLAAVAGGWALTDRYLDGRYANWRSSPLGQGQTYGNDMSRTYSWARGLRDTRIAVSGTQLQLPLWGTELSNHVQYVARRGAHGAALTPSSCPEWRHALASGGYRYVVVTPLEFPFAKSAPDPPELAWTRSDPGAVEVMREGRLVVFRLDRAPSAGRCA